MLRKTSFIAAGQELTNQKTGPQAMDQSECYSARKTTKQTTIQ